jgi:hypothetical protein
VKCLLYAMRIYKSMSSIRLPIPFPPLPFFHV